LRPCLTHRLCFAGLNTFPFVDFAGPGRGFGFHPFCVSAYWPDRVALMAKCFFLFFSRRCLPPCWFSSREAGAFSFSFLAKIESFCGFRGFSGFSPSCWPFSGSTPVCSQTIFGFFPKSVFPLPTAGRFWTLVICLIPSIFALFFVGRAHLSPTSPYFSPIH